MQPSRGQPADSLSRRLVRGEWLINHRKWGRSSQRFVAETVHKYGDQSAAWVQAFTMAMLGKDFLAAMGYVEGAKLCGLSNLDHGAMYRDLAIALVRARRYDLAKIMLDSARTLHRSEPDPNLLHCLTMVEGRMRFAMGDVAAAKRLLDTAAKEFDALHARRAANEQWRYNLLLRRMLVANRLYDKEELHAIRNKVRADRGRCTRKHFAVATLLMVPGGWKLLRRV